jgi:hypothetical protein
MAKTRRPDNHFFATSLLSEPQEAMTTQSGFFHLLGFLHFKGHAKKIITAVKNHSISANHSPP